jgi:hypothetical protein
VHALLHEVRIRDVARQWSFSRALYNSDA